MGTQVRSCPKCFQLMWLKQDHYEVIDEDTGPCEMSTLWINGPVPAGDGWRDRHGTQNGTLIYIPRPAPSSSGWLPGRILMSAARYSPIRFSSAGLMLMSLSRCMRSTWSRTARRG